MEASLTNTDIIFNILLNSNLDNVEDICATNIQAAKICNDENFWKTNYVYDKFPSVPVITNWKLTYIRMNQALNDVDAIVTISRVEKKRDAKMNDPYPNDGSIKILFRKERHDYTFLYIPKNIEPGQLPKLGAISLQIVFIPIDNDRYDMTYYIYDVTNDVEYESNVNVTINMMKDILTKAIYDNFTSKELEITDNEDTKYIPETRDIEHFNNINIINFNIINIKKHFTRLGMLDILKYSI